MKIRARIIKGFFLKEISQTLRDKKMAGLIFIAPIIQLTLFGFALTSDVRNIKYSCAYETNDYLMRQIDNNLQGSKYFIKANTSIEKTDLANTIGRNGIEVIIISPPETLQKAIIRGNAQIQLLIDAVNMQRAIQIENYVKNILNQTINEISDIKHMPVINTSIRILYNPSMNSSFFMIPALMGMLLCLITILITSMSLSKEKEFGTFEKLISSPISIAEILIGKILPYIVIAFTVVPLIILSAVILFNIHLSGGILKIFISCLIFIISSCSAAIFISTIAKTQQQAMMGTLMFLFPAMLLSGLIFPVENIPILIRWTAYINPLYYLVSLLRNIMLKGGNWLFVLQNCFMLLLIGMSLAIISIKKFNSKLN